jgi:hypothetical protein
LIYFITTADYKYFKIGYSKHPNKRLKQLQTGNHQKLGILCSMPGSLELEGFLKRQFSSFHARGE